MQVQSSDEERSVGEGAATVKASSSCGSICAEAVATHDPYQVLDSEVESFLAVLATQQVNLLVCSHVHWLTRLSLQVPPPSAKKSVRTEVSLLRCLEAVSPPLSFAWQGLSVEQLSVAPSTPER